MNIKYYVGHISVKLGLLFTLLVTQNANANRDLAFHEVASTVMINTLKKEPKDNFLKQLYIRLLYVPIWVKEDSLSSFSKALFQQIKNDKTLQKSTRLYLDALQLEQRGQEIYALNATLYQKVDFEFKMSQLYATYANYTLYGSINWGAFKDRLYNLKSRDIHAGWVTYKPRIGPISLIENAMLGATLRDLFAQAEPKEYRYKELQEALFKYLDIQEKGGWEMLPFKGILKPGDMHDIVPLLRQRLLLSEDYGSCKSKEDNVYDSCLKNAVIHFQKRHGMEDHGIIGRKTIASLNIPIKKRIEQIRLNLDRIKWLNERKNKRHIMINIPAFTLFLEEDKALRLEMKVIIGKRTNPTPVFSNAVQTIVLNPHWNVPKSIVQKELIPQIMKNPDAMKKENIEIRTGWGKEATKVSAGSIDWGQYRYSKTVPYRFAQLPGAQNALGKVKFLFPNPFLVYMHDTPTKDLFNHDVRAFSHGCIRLSEPVELLRVFATFNENIDFEKAKKRLEGTKKLFLTLINQVPLDVIYLTAFVDYNGVLQFREDIYGYDKMQLHSYRKW